MNINIYAFAGFPLLPQPSLILDEGKGGAFKFPSVAVPSFPLRVPVPKNGRTHGIPAPWRNALTVRAASNYARLTYGN